MAYQNLFDYMANNFGISLLQEDMQEIGRMVEFDKLEDSNPTQIVTETSIICKVCGKSFGDNLSLYEHYDTEHN